MSEKVTPELLKEIIFKLIGEINPVGATHIDDEREQNLNKYIGLLSLLTWELYDIAEERFDYRASVSSMGKTAHDFLENESMIFRDVFGVEELE